MTLKHLINFGGACLMTFFLTGCSHSSPEQHSAATPSAVPRAQLDQIQKDYGVVVNVKGSYIIIATPGLVLKEKMNQVEDAIHKAFGNSFTNYTISIITS